MGLRYLEMDFNFILHDRRRRTDGRLEQGDGRWAPGCEREDKSERVGKRRGTMERPRRWMGVRRQKESVHQLCAVGRVVTRTTGMVGRGNADDRGKGKGW